MIQKEEVEEEFVLTDETGDKQKIKKPTELILYESATVLELRNQIEQLNKKVDRIHYINMAARAAYVVLNPSYHLDQAGKHVLSKIATFMFKQFW